MSPDSSTGGISNPPARAGGAHPPSVLPSIEGLTFVCPLCRGALGIQGDGYVCSPCTRAYPVTAGIPDFRIFADPFLSFEEDLARTGIVLAALPRMNLAELLEHYWSFSDITPPELRKKFIRGVLHSGHKAERILRVVSSNSSATPRRVLEIGSGTGNFLASAHGFETVVGIDIAMRWLHVSRRRFLDLGLPTPPLVCCCAEHLPFAAGSFDVVVSASTLEFVRNPSATLGEAGRVLDDSGTMFVNTVNRYSVAVNPYASLWGVGFLPRRWQAAYVRCRNGSHFEHTRVLSLAELTRLAREHFSSCEVALPDIEDDALQRFPAFTRFQVHSYRRLKRLPLARTMLKWIAPEWDVQLSGRRR